MLELLQGFWESTGFSELVKCNTELFGLRLPGELIMICIACVFLYLAIKKGFEPYLLIPIAFGMLLVNLPLAGLMAHAVGDQAVTIMVNAIEKALAQYPRENHRHRIEHCGLTNPELIARIAKLGIIPISNPSFITINGRDYNRYYGDRVDYLFALRSYLDAGIITAIGSDSPVTHPNPMNSLYGALNRKDRKNGDSVGEMQKVDVPQIIRMFTYNGAYASFEENIKGSLEPGKLADIVVLSEDLLTYPAEDVQSVEVLYTLVDGKVVYTRS